MQIVATPMGPTNALAKVASVEMVLCAKVYIVNRRNLNHKRKFNWNFLISRRLVLTTVPTNIEVFLRSL